MEPFAPITSANVNTPAQKIERTTPLQFIPGIGPHRVSLFHKIGVHKASDLLFLFPRTYQDVAPYQDILHLTEGERATVVGQIVDTDSRYSFSGRGCFGILISLQGGGFVRCVWYNQMFRQEKLKRGMNVVATGTPKSTGISFEMRHPEVLLLAPGEQPPSQRPIPIYPLTEGLLQKHVHSAVNAALDSLASTLDEALPQSLRRLAADKLKLLSSDQSSLHQPLLIDPDPQAPLEQNKNITASPVEELYSIQEALRKIHNPDSLHEAHLARQRFIFQELLVYQMAIALQRSRFDAAKSAPCIEATPIIHSRILKRFPFHLTNDQLSAIEDVRRDMNRDVPMNRLVQGDVGSGKTAIAQYAMLNAVANKYQAALMVPTELLARQHFERLSKQLANSQVMVELLTGSLSQREQNELQQRIAIGTVDIVVGTQALLSNRIEFHNLGLVVIDEQHKFGVAQRAALKESRIVPHYLVLSATPIPRSIAMTQFGDLDVSIIKDKPPGRAPVHTYLGSTEQQTSWWEFVRKQIHAGRQAYVILPRVEQDSESDSLGAEQVFQQLRENEFAGNRVGLLHGRMDGEEKQRRLDEFNAGEIQLLVATTVVEVGIDVPNATIMTILDADRLGLAQLHQLRGRVSRGGTPGYVCVFPRSGVDAKENERLKIFASTEDGFQLAEEDLKLRGWGDLLGLKQVGSASLRIADLARDGDVLTIAREVARSIIASDPGLEDPSFERLRKQIVGRHGSVASFGDVG
ncbi:MAG: ATP-dependent DNA helicase RecG [Pirellula sp.]|jgi:ATP-dependent DNA helicase RecG|nr:ATP-dependent DNA helicase RecG [Pirellula sp.]